MRIDPAWRVPPSEASAGQQNAGSDNGRSDTGSRDVTMPVTAGAGP
jgi:hypothetical protein